MDPFEIESALRSFKVIVDTREHMTPKASERIGAFGVESERATLSFGDYCGNILLPNGQELYAPSSTISASCVVERKQSLDELAGNFTRGRDRFRREFERAASANAKIYLLVEGASWEGLMGHRYRSRYHPEAFKASLLAWMIRYNMVPVFCKSGISGVLIKDILYRDMKERLERGEFG